jgi:hypothetical protein
MSYGIRIQAAAVTVGSARTILSGETVRADVTHLVRCIQVTWNNDGAARRASMFSSLGESALTEIESYGATPDDEELAGLVRSAKYRIKIKRAAARDRRPDVGQRIDDAHHALHLLGREVFYRLASHVEQCRCSLHERGL